MQITNNMPDGQAALAQVLADWNCAGETWNAAAIAAVYTEDAMLFGGRPGHSVGREAIQRYFASYEGAIHFGAMTLSDIVLRILGSDCVLAQGMAEFSFKLSDGQCTRSALRATLVLNRAAGRWHILNHHFSTVPAVPPLGKD
ncbi:YybH family protein [Allopusillimonas ginsengisoli]|uniref:YybH family protein n=1 Tax=Allopusillimonas ginsengisoli TaxID=453575 RepID=UPI00101F2AAD|nr:SgcJ/EcaC family oxidoreductase [Allopusillimonas ginsengisoli]TEA71900.1 SgcJ/EcaC family oxidoreductase [Allopusillimonas ginsengisoli]